MKGRSFEFLKDVLILAFTSFGGPQVHYALYHRKLADEKQYLSREDILEIQALCSVLPGPTSTQVLISIGYRLGGPNLAYLTLITWIMPAVIIMALSAYGLTYLKNREVLTYILPVGIGLLVQTAWMYFKMVVKGWLYVVIFLFTIGFAYYFQSPYVFPIAIFLGGLISTFNYDKFPKQNKHKLIIPWSNFHLFWGTLVLVALLGRFTDYFPIKLFENFYRNGALVFGGGQVLAPVLYTEFVEFKHLISSEDFLAGMALSRTLPGPVFSFTSFLGVLLMKDYGTSGEIMGALIGAAGVFLPGTFLIFFLYRIWGQLKQFRIIRASLAGIQAASVGLTFVAILIFMEPMVLQSDYKAIFVVFLSFLFAQFTQLPAIILFIVAILAGLII